MKRIKLLIISASVKPLYLILLQLMHVWLGTSTSQITAFKVTDGYHVHTENELFCSETNNRIICVPSYGSA